MIGEHPNTTYSHDFPEPRPARAPERRNRPPAWVRVIGISIIVAIVLTALAGLLTGITALIAFSNPPAVTSSDQTFTVAGAPTLRLDADFADVTVITGGTGQVSVHTEARVRALSAGAARDAVNQLR